MRMARRSSACGWPGGKRPLRETPQGTHREGPHRGRGTPQGGPHRGDPTGGTPQGGPHRGDPTEGTPQGGPHRGDPTGGTPQGGTPQGGTPQGGDPTGEDPTGVDPMGKVVCGWLEVVCGWPGGRLRMARGPSADGPEVVRGWPVAVCSQMAQGLAVPLGRRRKMGEIRVDRGWPGLDPAWSAARP